MLVLSNTTPEDFITASFQTKVKTMNEMNKTENEAEDRMNETENSQTEESESTDKFSFIVIKEKSQESKKSPNCLTKSYLQKIQMSTKIMLYNFWVKRLFAKTFKNVKAMDQLHELYNYC